METRTSRGARKRLALTALAALWLAACGGGGGGGDATASTGAAAPGSSSTSAPIAAGPATPTPSSAGAGTPSPAPAVTSPATPAPAAAPAAARSVDQAGDLWLTTSHAGTIASDQVARLADGSYVAVHDDHFPGQPFEATSVLLQRLDAVGNPAGPEQNLGQGIAPGVTAFRDGTFLVTWEDPPSQSPFVFTVGVHAQRYDAAGVPAGAQMSLGTFPRSVRPIALSDGSFLLAAWGANSQVQGPPGFVAGFSRTGTPTGFNAALADPDSCGIVGLPAVAAVPSGGFSIAWLHTCVGPTELRLRTYDANASLLASSSMTVQDGSASVGLAALTSGNLALQWTVVTPQGPSELHALVVAPTTLPTSPAAASSAPIQAGRTPLPVQSLDDGGFLVPWSASNADEVHVPVTRYSGQGELR